MGQYPNREQLRSLIPAEQPIMMGDGNRDEGAIEPKPFPSELTVALTLNNALPYLTKR